MGSFLGRVLVVLHSTRKPVMSSLYFLWCCGAVASRIYQGSNNRVGSGLVFIHFTSLLQDDSKIKYSISFVDEIHHHLDVHILFFWFAVRTNCCIFCNN